MSEYPFNVRLGSSLWGFIGQAPAFEVQDNIGARRRLPAPPVLFPIIFPVEVNAFAGAAQVENFLLLTPDTAKNLLPLHERLFAGEAEHSVRFNLQHPVGLSAISSQNPDSLRVQFEIVFPATWKAFLNFSGDGFQRNLAMVVEQGNLFCQPRQTIPKQ